MSKKRSADGPKITEDEARKMDNKHACLKEDYLELQKDVRGLRKKVKKSRHKKEQLEVEVRFLRSRKMMLITKKSAEITYPEASSEDRLRMMCTDRRNMASIEGLATGHEPTTHGSPHLFQVDKSPHISSVPERTAGLQLPNSAGYQTPSITPIVESASRKRRLESNDTLESSEPKVSKRKKTKGAQKTPIPLTNAGTENSFWDKN